MQPYALRCLTSSARYLGQTMRAFPRLTVVVMLAIALCASLLTPPQQSQLQRIFDRGELVIVTRNEPTAYYTDQHGATGFDYQLANDFATSLGLNLRVIKANDLPQLQKILATGKADLAAAALVKQDATPTLHFSSGYLDTKARIIYSAKGAKPTSIDDLDGHTVAVLRGSANARLLANTVNHKVAIKTINSASSGQLLKLVNDGAADYAIIDNRAYTLQQPLFPQVKAAFSFADKQQYAWAMAPNADNSLYQAVEDYFQRSKTPSRVASLATQFLGKHSQFSLYASLHFVEHINDRLPALTDDFYQAGAKTDLDWRLLAAMGYQESRWDPEARSPTGVRGIMMLTLATARALGVDRENPAQSIDGGARYLRDIIDGLPQQIRQPDRLWMAIASYNIGYAHLEDARVLTQRQGGSPNSWPDVRQRLLLLSDPNYHSTLRYGWADGKQAVSYVDRVQQYYTMMILTTEDGQGNTTLLAAN